MESKDLCNNMFKTIKMCISYLVHSVEESSLEKEGGSLNSKLKDELVSSVSILHGKKLKKKIKKQKKI